MTDVNAAFYESIAEVMERMVGEEATIDVVGDPGAADYEYCFEGAMNLRADDGSPSARRIAVFLDAAATDELVNRIIGFPDDGPTEQDRLDGVGELLNVIAGGVKARLAGTDQHFLLSVPTTHRLAEEQPLASDPSAITTLVVGFSDGRFVVRYTGAEGS